MGRRVSSFAAARTNDDGARVFPPTLDSLLEDEGFGAYDYQPVEPDAYEVAEMKRQEEVVKFVVPEKQQPAVVKAVVKTTSKAAALPDIAEESDPYLLVEEAKEVKVPPMKMEPEPLNYGTGTGTAGTAPPQIPSSSVRELYTPPSLEELEGEIEKLTQEIYKENNGAEFNIKSIRQVSTILFGPLGGSTEKTILEAKAASGHRMSALILDYRALLNNVRKAKRKEDNEAKGTQVHSPADVARDESIEESADPLLLVDASAYIFRAYYR
jgi:hypothetical protein